MTDATEAWIYRVIPEAFIGWYQVFGWDFISTFRDGGVPLARMRILEAPTERDCPECGGEGTIQYEPPGRWDVVTKTCEECGGWGKVEAA